VTKRIGIVGTRFTELHSGKWLSELEKIINSLPPNTEVFVNGAPGTDQEAVRLATERGLKTTVLFSGSEFDNDPKFFMHRNSTVIESTDEVYAIWDGLSPGTQHAIALAKRLGTPIHVINVLSEDWERFS
tara:strand:- start:3809 stop:4198 length:390 start_codon:yes stop_codon:yes gene_type:complete